MNWRRRSWWRCSWWGALSWSAGGPPALLAGFFGFIGLGYRNSVDAGPIHLLLLIAPLAFFWGGLFAFIGKFTQAPPATKT